MPDCKLLIDPPILYLSYGPFDNLEPRYRVSVISYYVHIMNSMIFTDILCGLGLE